MTTDSPADLQFRIATPLDLDAIADMMVDFNRFEGITWSKDSGAAALRALLCDSALGIVGVFEKDNDAIGYCVMTWGFDLEWNGRDAFLTELYLIPKVRGQHLGRAAIAFVEKAARDHGAQALHLMVRHENEPARKLYDRSGFKVPPRAFMSKVLRPWTGV
jgi:ribosomal protein S18 acetylase RimI-like enzyme